MRSIISEYRAVLTEIIRSVSQMFVVCLVGGVIFEPVVNVCVCVRYDELGQPVAP